MDSLQTTFNAYIESTCAKYGCTDMIAPLQEGFSVLCEAEGDNSLEIHGVKVVSQDNSWNIGRFIGEIGTDTVRCMDTPEGKIILPQENYNLAIEAPDAPGKIQRCILSVSDFPCWEGEPVLDGIKPSDGFVFVRHCCRHAVTIYQNGHKVACYDTPFSRGMIEFYVPYRTTHGDIWNEIGATDRMPGIPSKEFNAQKLRSAAAFIQSEYDRLQAKRPPQRRVDRVAVRRAVGNFLFDKFEDIVEDCDKEGYTTEDTIRQVKRAVNDDYYTEDPGAIGGKTLHFPEAGLSEER